MLQGCNIPDIDVVVQWKLPASLSIFVQRAGHAARNKARNGLAVLLVEPSAYSVDIVAKNLQQKETATEKGKKKKKKKHTVLKAVAVTRGLKRL